MNTAQFLETCENSIQPAKLNVTIIYETAADGFRAKRLSDQLAMEVADDHDINLHVWNFQVLALPEIREIAAKTAATADVVILSVSGSESLPKHLVEWIALWPCFKDFKNPAVYTLYADSVHEKAPIRADLTRMGKDLNFL